MSRNIKESNEKIQLFYLLSLTTGLRVNEILNLTYGDVDEKNSILSCLTVKQRKVDIVINASLLEIIKKESELNRELYQKNDNKKIINISTKKNVKITIPGPMTIFDTTHNDYYKDKMELLQDLATVINYEILHFCANLSKNQKIAAAR